MPGPTQLPLVLPHVPNLGREDFIPGASNLAALRMIESWPDWPAPVVLLTGPAGSGKTHLVHIWSARAGARIVPAAELSADSAGDPATANFAIEDVDKDTAPEVPLFHLINAARERGGSVLITSRTRAEDWRIGVPDLRSRLRLASPVALGAPEDDLLRQVLVKLFADRQLDVDKPVIDYLIARMERSLSAAVDLVAGLDHAALAAGRRITRGMAAEIMAESTDSADEFADRQ